MSKIWLILWAALVASSAGAQTMSPSPYAGEERRAVKSLSPQQVADLKAGRGMGLSLVAELNHYPGPKHVLELVERLRLTPTQHRHVTEIEAAMRGDAVQLGVKIYAKETELDTLFASGKADSEQAGALIREIARLQGELRLVHVNAHLATKRWLTAEQIARYDKLRGYAEGHAPKHGRH